MYSCLEYIGRTDKEGEAHLLRQWANACDKTEIICSCGQIRHLTLAFRCLYCGEWFCAHCAEKHFGKTVKEWVESKKTNKTWSEWAGIFGDIIMDPDGFRDLPEDHLYSEKEYKSRIGRCTQMLKF